MLTFCVPVSLLGGELKVDEAVLFSQSDMSEALTGSSYSAHVERFNTPYTPQLTGKQRPSTFLEPVETNVVNCYHQS